MDIRFVSERLNYILGGGSKRLVEPSLQAQVLTTTFDNTKVLGIDVSDWDGNVNFNASVKAGVKFVFIKCQDGTIKAKYWLTNRKAAIAAGLLVGDYTWLYADRNVSCKAQAVALWNLLKTETRQLPPVVDFEWTRFAGAQSNPNYDDLDKFVTAYNAIADRKPILYSAAGYMNQFGKMPDTLRRKFSEFWFANYGVVRPSLPLGFAEWGFWQFTATLPSDVFAPSSTGKKEADGNYWKGDMNSLLAFAGLSGLPLPPTDPPSAPPSVPIKITLTKASRIIFEQEIFDD